MNGKRVLIVEDEADFADALQEALCDAGFEVVVAASAFAALEIVARWRPDVALVDIGLPGFDGYQLTEALRGHASLGDDLWVLAVTARHGPTDREKAQECGMDMFLTKPVDLDDLCGVLARLVESTRRLPQGFAPLHA